MADEKLIEFIEQVSGGSHLRVEENLGNGFVRLRTEEAERRQAKHDIRSVEDIIIEMLRNARDANASNIYIATAKEGNQRSIVVIDDGEGIPSDLQELIFEPRVTSKLESMIEDDWGIHGRGMALYSIMSNTVSAGVVASGSNLGSSIAVLADTSMLQEKVDQSTFPHVNRDEEGNLIATKGPHNILRTALEFALVHKKAPNVFLGPPSAIAMTMLERSSKQINSDTLLFCDDLSKLPVTSRLAACADAQDLMQNCVDMGLDISERTAHRILSGQITALPSLYEMAKAQFRRMPGADLLKDNRGLKLSEADSEAFAREMERAFEILAQRYYLSLVDMPTIKAKGDTITVRFKVEKD